MDISYRQIAKMLARGMPIEGQEYSELIESYIKSIEAMPLEQRSTLRASYIFSCKAPREERQDLFQELVSHSLTQLAKCDKRIKNIEAFCYRIAQRRWKDLRVQKRRRLEILNGGFLSLNVTVSDSEYGDIELQDTIAGETDFESELNSELDSQAVWDSLPDNVKPIVEKRLDFGKQNRGYTIKHSELKKIWRYAKKNEDAIREALRA